MRNLCSPSDVISELSSLRSAFCTLRCLFHKDSQAPTQSLRLTMGPSDTGVFWSCRKRPDVKESVFTGKYIFFSNDCHSSACVFLKNQNNWAYMTSGIRNHIWSLDGVLAVYSIYITRGRYEYRSAMSPAFIFIRLIYEYGEHRTLYTLGALKMLFQSHKSVETTGTIFWVS